MRKTLNSAIILAALLSSGLACRAQEPFPQPAADAATEYDRAVAAAMADTAAIEHRDSLFLSVEQLFEQGVLHSLQLQADAMEELAAGERERTARTERYPDLQVGLKGGFVGQPVVFRHGLTGAYRPDSPDWSQNYVVDFAQPLYQGGRIRYTIRKADLEKRLAVLRTSGDRAEVKLSLLDQYLQLFTLYREQEVLTRNIEESELRLRDIRRMKEEGLITNNDVLRSEMQLTNDRLSLRETQNSIELASQQLDILLGLEETLLLRPDSTLLYSRLEMENYESYIAEAYANDPTMRQLRMQTELAQNDVRLTRSASLPTLSLYASNTLARPIARTLEDLYNNNWNVGLQMSVPLFALYKNRYKVRESRIAVSLRRNAEEQEMQRIRVRVRTAFLRHQEARQQVEALKLSVRQAQENYRIMQNRYLNQLAILTDLLDANSVRLNVELQLTAARTRVIYTYYQLQKACGRL